MARHAIYFTYGQTLSELPCHGAEENLLPWGLGTYGGGRETMKHLRFRRCFKNASIPAEKLFNGPGKVRKALDYHGPE